MVAKQIQRELSDMLLTDKVLQYAILPEASLGADRYLSSLTTISDVEVSGDLQVFPCAYAIHLCVCFCGLCLNCKVMIFIAMAVCICGCSKN